MRIWKTPSELRGVELAPDGEGGWFREHAALGKYVVSMSMRILGVQLYSDAHRGSSYGIYISVFHQAWSSGLSDR